ncbi:MAG: terpene cyclase/mutase family protein [Gemmataceae bacterium]|nr:terpene cyclase/mutase family protein [Gemmataceae bacterium]
MVAIALSLPSTIVAADPPKREPRDEAVDRALAALKLTQEDDGSWKGGPSKNPAVTSLGVLAYLSASHAPGMDPYGELVEKGIQAVLKFQLENGVIGREGSHEMYHHGICTLMLATARPRLKGKVAEEVDKALEKALAVILKALRTEGEFKGGWRYLVQGNDADLSLTGWQVQALRAVKKAGGDVPEKTLEMARDYVRRNWVPSAGAYSYRVVASRVTVACTAIGIIAGDGTTDKGHLAEMEKAAAYLQKNSPRWGSAHCLYTVYYVSRAGHQAGGDMWKELRPKLHKELLDNQSKTGLWQGSDAEGRAFGPNYCTALAVLALTVDGYTKAPKP